MSFDKRAIYNDRIKHLMDQVQAICVEEKIAMVAAFDHYEDAEKYGRAVYTFSTGELDGGNASPAVLKAINTLQPKQGN